jgi:hypothetical protein
VQAPNEEKSDDTKDSFFEEPGSVFNQFTKYHMKILLDFKAKAGRENIFKLTVMNEMLQEISNDNEVRMV